MARMNLPRYVCMIFSFLILFPWVCSIVPEQHNVLPQLLGVGGGVSIPSIRPSMIPNQPPENGESLV